MFLALVAVVAVHSVYGELASAKREQEEVCTLSRGGAGVVPGEEGCGGRRKVALVTGGAGFIAHHVIEGLLDSTDWDIISLDRLDFSGNLNRIHDMMKDKDRATKRRVRIIFCDLRSSLNDQLVRDIGQVRHQGSDSFSLKHICFKLNMD